LQNTAFIYRGLFPFNKSIGKELFFMFTGEFEHNIDPKNRIFVPAKFREELGETFVVSRDIRGPRLRVFSLEGWNEYIAPILKQERRISEKALRYLHRNAIQVKADAQGRILLTKDLIDYACITKSAVIVGCSSYAEIWSAENWAAELESEDSMEIALELERFGL
jgi:MraZ protein